MRNSAICGPDLDNPEEKRDMGKAEQFRQKRRCKSIRAPTEAEIASLEENLKQLDGIFSPSGIGKTTSVVFTLQNRVGNLANALKIFQVSLFKP